MASHINKIIVFLSVYAISSVNSFALDDGPPSLLDLPKHIVQDSRTFVDTSFREDKLPAITEIAAATAVLLHYDQDLRNGAEKLGKRLNLDSDDKTKTYIKEGRWNIFRGPSDMGSSLYFLGDGWVHSSISLGFYTYGVLGADPRAKTTGYALVEGLVTSTLITQLLKHITGRESPSTTSVAGGVWRFFPDQGKYAKDQNKYNAYPSGHVTTAMMTMTVISGSYPDNKYIQPVGYTLMTLLAFQMVNNGAHWASDYPLAIGIGYSVGKISLANAGGKPAPKKAAADKPAAAGPDMHLLPYFTADASGLMMLYRM